jgi:4-hydroxybenzoate polyprenyltransferase
MNHPKDLWRLLRPHQWIKNAFVFTGLIFGHAWNDVGMAIKVVIIAIAFSLMSSSAYIINDIVDVERDRIHPKKKTRPVAARQVSESVAALLSVFIGFFGLSLGFFISYKALIILMLYALLNFAYSFYLKNIVILDVFCIAAGFMLRIFAGTVGVGIPPTKWLVLCGLMITLFLGFAKRRAEILTLRNQKEDFREVLTHYSSDFLDQIITICAAGIITTYSLYTMSAETMRIHQTQNLIYAVPFVIYALFRYIFLLHKYQLGGEPSRDLLKDKQIIIAVIGWAVLTFLIIYKSKL